MIREYYVRGSRKTVEEIDGVVAVKVPADDRDGARARTAFGAPAALEDSGMDGETAEAFQYAAWRFVGPTDTATRALAQPTDVPEADDAGKLVRRESGRFGIVTRRLNVQLSADVDEADAEQVLADLGLVPLTRLRFANNLYEAWTTRHEDALDASVQLNGEPRVAFAEPSFTEHIPSRFRPADARYADQWHWDNTGQGGGTVGADVRAESAWDRTFGAGVSVAVIDNGFNAAHEDLAAGVASSSGFFVEGAAGAVSFTAGTVGMPGGNHGTMCAGMVGARQGNARGGSGAAPECDLILVAVLPDQVDTQTTLARAVAYTADPSLEVPGASPDSGADILVSSLGPNGADWDLTLTLELALDFAAANGRGGRGLAIFWAASNGFNVDVLADEVVSHPDVIAVVRSTKDDLEDNAARGSEVELIAPGVNVLMPNGSGGYSVSTGTSFAAPCAAGCAALALSVNPQLGRDDLRALMRDTADKIGGVTYDAAGHHDDYGFGRVNAQRAVEEAARSVTT